jgi:uroporphyrin-III C-methyltransferase
MQLDLDVSGRRVVIFGTYVGARRVIRRYVASGAKITMVVDGRIPSDVDSADPVRFVRHPGADDVPGLLRLVGVAWLVVLVDAEPDSRERVCQLAAHLRIVVASEPAADARGRVILVGGGPGSTSLLTLAACEALKEADVVFYDRLAPSDQLAQLAPGAELIDVGKTPYHHRTSQDRIEDLLIERARRGEVVVRLKGGDPFVFGRGGEEILACTKAGIGVRVVSGVSSAIAVPAAAGIPVTHRNLSRVFTVISGHVVPKPDELSALARLGGTIVILMGIANLTAILAGLREAGLPDEMPTAVIERGFSDSQRTTRTTVERLAYDARRLDVVSPAVVVIGEVARLGAHLSDALPAPVINWAEAV